MTVVTQTLLVVKTAHMFTIFMSEISTCLFIIRKRDSKMKKIGLFIGLLLVLMLIACGKSTANTDNTGSIGKTENSEVNTKNTSENVAEDKTNKEQNVDTEQNEETKNAESADFSYGDLKGIEFYFSSGAGGWCTTLTVDVDGSFKGEYFDSDMGDIGEEYPNGVQYKCVFTGQFKDLTKVDELTYSTEIESISYENKMGTEEIVDGIRYIYADAYGLDDPKTIYFYLEGTDVTKLSEGMMSWIQSSLYDYETEQEATKLPYVGMYNENSEQGFSSYSMVENLFESLEWYESMDQDYTNRLQTDATLTQMEMTTIASERNTMWDRYLNSIWTVLFEIKSSEEMVTIKAEENEWIAKKEAAVTEAGSEFEGGSMQSMIKNDIAAEMTKERVYVLLELLK